MVFSFPSFPISPPVLKNRPDLWAPDVSGPIDGKYYLYYAVSTFGSQSSAIGVAVSESMDVGTWTDLGSTGVTSSKGSPYNSIDGNLISTSEGYFLSFGSFWQDLYQVPMSSPPTKSSGTPYNIAFNSSGAHAVEGGFVFANEGYYYLFFSSGICCKYDISRPAKGDEYRIHVCRSTAVGGPYVSSNTR
jgi:arabinan endo-1,5-alpha-L-arabinosidase